MKPVDIEMKVRIAQREADTWREILKKKACANCMHQQQGGGCSLADGVVPPPEVQKTGCASWEYDEIPF